MAKGNADKLERNDIYTAFAVLALFVLFGYFISSGGGDALEQTENVWVEQPIVPTGYQGYPFPHDDESITRMPVEEELSSLPTRKLMPVASKVDTTAISLSTGESAKLTEKKFATTAPQPTTPIRENVTLEPVAQPILDKPKVEQMLEQTVPAAAVKDKVKELVKPTPKPAPKPKPKATPKPKAKPAAPALVTKPTVTKPTVTKSATGINYITNKLPCVWVVGIFKNPGNVNRVVARLRLNKFDVATGLHEKGTYVGVPCACENAENTQAELREIFAAQPWLLRK